MNPAHFALALACAMLPAQELPGWWKALAEMPHLESRFTQESESAVFGRMRKSGRLQVSRGGRLRVAYDEGLLLVGDGRTLVQFDPEGRTAQRFDLRRMAVEMPLVRILLDPKSLGEVYRIKAVTPGRIVMEPRTPGLPTVEAEGQGRFLAKLTWLDATGAKQVLSLSQPRTPASIPDTVYKARVPKGTRWIQ